MSDYFKTDQIQLPDFDPNAISAKYNQGFVLTRLSKGSMDQTRSLRVDLSLFELNSENRRILKKTEDLEVEVKTLPLEDYSWQIHALGKDFYTKKFGDGTMSASKIKELFQESESSNMTSAFVFDYANADVKPNPAIEMIVGTNYSKIMEDIRNKGRGPLGYCLAYINDEIVHYAYPFYDLDIPKEQNLGIAMMTKAIIWAKENGKKYIYLGSVVDPSSKYKLQFEGLEWFDTDNKHWNQDIQSLKLLLNN